MIKHNKQSYLDGMLTTAAEALNFFIEMPRKMVNGELVVVVDEYTDKDMMFRFMEAKQALTNTPELKTLLELRILDMKRLEAQVKLSKIKGI